MEAGLDGSFPQIIATGQAGPEELAVRGPHLYWTNSYSPGTIVEAGLDEGEVIAASPDRSPFGVAVSTS